MAYDDEHHRIAVINLPGGKPQPEGIAGEFFFSPAFAINPIGVDFDLAESALRFRAGEDEAAIKRRPDSGARGVGTISLR